MNMLEKLVYCNQILLDEMPEYQSEGYKFPRNQEEQYRLFRSLTNLRPPAPMSGEFLAVQDELLTQMVADCGVISLNELTPTDDNYYLWQGDITRLKVDAIVNAANDAMRGCFVPCHKCIDNAIHSAAGVQLRLACHQMMTAQGCRESTGQAKITEGYNLPSRHIIHTVGPIIHGDLTQQDCDFLASCYRSCLELAISKGLESIAFCCISTGEFHFPNDVACQIAVDTVTQVLQETQSEIKVIFNVFKDHDYQLYQQRLDVAKR